MKNEIIENEFDKLNHEILKLKDEKEFLCKKYNNEL